MDNPFTRLFEAIDNSGLSDKEDLRKEISSIVLSCCVYFEVVSREQLYYLSTPKERIEKTRLKNYDDCRREAHDLCIDNCIKLNEICRIAGVEKICDFDTSDRRKAAEFAGYVAGIMFISNISCEEELQKWWGEYPL